MAELPSQSQRRKAWRLSIAIALAALLALVAPSAPTALALPGTRYVMDFQQGGQSPAWVVANAAMAVSELNTA